MKGWLTALSILLTVAIENPMALSDNNNLLTNADFENPLGSIFANVAGFAICSQSMGAEAASSVSTQNGISPNTGNAMLRVNPNTGTVSQTVQLLNVNNLATTIDNGNARISFSTFVNCDANFTTGPTASISIFFINSVLSGNLLSNTSNHTGPFVGQSLATDTNPATWEKIEIQNSPVPVGTRHVLVQISFNNSSLGNLPGYADTSSLCIESTGVPNIFLSYSGLGTGCARINRNLKNPQIGSNFSIYVWVSDDYDIDTGLCLDVFTTSTGVIQFTNATTLEANIFLGGTTTPIGVRWGDFAGTAPVSPYFVDELCAFNVSQGTGILTSQTTGSFYEDELHDNSIGTDAFLFAVIDCVVEGNGATDICAVRGDGGAVHNATALTPIICSASVNGIVPGDVNGDCVADLLDVSAFISILSNNTYSAAADMNCDGLVNLLDVELFVLAVSNSC